MVNKKKNKKTEITVDLFVKRRVICIRRTIAQQKKTGIERRKYLEPKKYEEYKNKEVDVSENIVKKKRCHRNYRSALQRQPQK